MRPKLEVCVDSIESVLAANEGGADRIELCSALEVGGLTPSIGLVKQTQLLCPELPIYAMIRPRSGDFCYSDDEIQIMVKDIQVLKTHGIHGFVFGILRTDGTIDQNNCRLLLETAGPAQCTFHRAFDLITDPKKCLEEVIELGFKRILTSGQSTNALTGITNIGRLVELANNRIIVMAGAGITEINAKTILNETKVREFHSSASVLKQSLMIFKNKEVSMGKTDADEYTIKVVSKEKVRNLIEIANQFN